MKNYQYILLDWDGNLARTLDVWLEAIKGALADEGYNPPDKDISAALGKIIEYFSVLGIHDPNAVFDRADQIAKEKLPNVELYPDALEVLEYFKAVGKKTALITTSSRKNIDHLLDRFDMHWLFDVIVTGEMVSEHKPHPESLFMALEELGGNVDEAIMIGDSDKDLGAANNAGVDSVLFYPPEHEKYYHLESLKEHAPTVIVDDFRKIMEIVR